MDVANMQEISATTQAKKECMYYDPKNVETQKEMEADESERKKEKLRMER